MTRRSLDEWQLASQLERVVVLLVGARDKKIKKICILDHLDLLREQCAAAYPTRKVLLVVK